jgi:hypothetical protein
MHMASREAIAWAVRSHPDPVVSVSDVVDALDEDVSRETVRQRLTTLEAAGTLGRKDVGARAVAWWHTDRVTPPATDPADDPAQTALDDAKDDVAERPDRDDRRDDVDDETAPALEDVVDDSAGREWWCKFCETAMRSRDRPSKCVECGVEGSALEERDCDDDGSEFWELVKRDVDALEPPGNDRRQEQRRRAVRLAITYIAKEGEARAADIRETIHENEPAGYETARSLWVNSLRDGLQDVEAVELLDDHDGIWTTTR